MGKRDSLTFGVGCTGKVAPAHAEHLQSISAWEQRGKEKRQQMQHKRCPICGPELALLALENRKRQSSW